MRHFLEHRAYAAPLPSEEELDIYVENVTKDATVHGAVNCYRANLAVTTDPFTLADRTLSDVPMTFLHGVGDLVVPSTVPDDIPKYHTNYTMEYMPDRGHYAMLEKPEIVVDRPRANFR